MTQWGDRIEVNGVRPGWLRDGESPSQVFTDGEWSKDYEDTEPVTSNWQWTERDGLTPRIIAIRLPADHPYYTATAAGFIYWPGGDSAPDDWDGSKPVLLYDRTTGSTRANTFESAHGNIVKQIWMVEPAVGFCRAIGYHKRTTDDTVSVRRMTEAEWHEKYIDYRTSPAARALVISLGLLKPDEPTEAERISATTGIPVPTVQAVLDAQAEA